jgi:hypothetical protein
MCKNIALLDTTFVFTCRQFKQIIAGRVVTEMGDRWFLFMEDLFLYCHWFTGECIYRLHFRQDGSNFVTDEILAVNDPSIKPVQTQRDEIEDLKTLLQYDLLGGEPVKES